MKERQATVLGAWVVAASVLDFYSSSVKAWHRSVRRIDSREFVPSYAGVDLSEKNTIQKTAG